MEKILTTFIRHVFGIGAFISSSTEKCKTPIVFTVIDMASREITGFTVMVFNQKDSD